jgi:excinuclease ABC subunit C
MCLGGAALDQYNDSINKIIGLLQGIDQGLLEAMERRMIEASERFEFEEAVKCRDTLDAIQSLINKEKVIEFTESNKNMVVIETLTDCDFKLFLINKNNILFCEKYRWSELALVHETIKNKILTTFTTKEAGTSKRVSRDDIDTAQIIYSYLRGSNCSNFIISEQLLDAEDTTKLDDELNKLLHLALNY